MVEGTTAEVLLDAIKAAAVGSSNQGTSARAATLRDLALAYRYVTGGPQPGSVTINK